MKALEIATEIARVARLVHEALNPDVPWNELSEERQNLAVNHVRDAIMPLLEEISTVRQALGVTTARAVAAEKEVHRRVHDQRVRLLGAVGSQITAVFANPGNHPSPATAITPTFAEEVALAAARVTDALLVAAELPFQSPAAAPGGGAEATAELARAVDEGEIAGSDAAAFVDYAARRAGVPFHSLTRKQVAVLLNTWRAHRA